MLNAIVLLLVNLVRYDVSNGMDAISTANGICESFCYAISVDDCFIMLKGAEIEELIDALDYARQLDVGDQPFTKGDYAHEMLLNIIEKRVTDRGGWSL